MLPQFISACDKQWICKTCHNELKQGLLPSQAQAKNSVLGDVPAKLSDLNSPAICLISLRILFMKMVALPCGKHHAIHGPAVNRTPDLTSVCIPFLKASISNPDGSKSMNIKNKLCYKRHYVYQHIWPAKGACSSIMVEIVNHQLYMQEYRDEQWLAQ